MTCSGLQEILASHTACGPCWAQWERRATLSTAATATAPRCPMCQRDIDVRQGCLGCAGGDVIFWVFTEHPPFGSIWGIFRECCFCYSKLFNFLGGCGRYRLAIIHSFLWYRYIMGNMYLLAIWVSIFMIWETNIICIYLWEICIYGMAILLWVSCLLWALIRNFLGPWLSKSKDMRMQTARIACQRLGHIGHSIWIFTQG